jgi:4-diphosphocytidyl-2C-methyl-D-erythritol kinase
MMSGSGSAVFGFVSGRKDGERVARELATKPWDVFLARTL